MSDNPATAPGFEIAEPVRAGIKRVLLVSGESHISAIAAWPGAYSGQYYNAARHMVYASAREEYRTAQGSFQSATIILRRIASQCTYMFKLTLCKSGLDLAAGTQTPQ